MNTLDLFRKEIPIIPKDIQDFLQQPEYFKVLLAQHTKTHSLSGFVSFQKLFVLDLSHNNLGQFFKTGQLNGLFLLRCLILKNNNITSFYDCAFQTTQNLQLLDLSDNKVTKCGKAFIVLQKLVTLNLNNNKISDLDSFKIFKNKQILSLQFLGLSLNCIEDKYQTRFEESLIYYFPKLNFILTRFCQQRDKNAFNEILEYDYYIEEINKQEQPKSDVGYECSFVNNDSLELMQLIDPYPNCRSSAKKSRKSANSADSRFSSFKKQDPDYVQRQIDNRKKELLKLDQTILIEKQQKEQLKKVTEGLQQFLQESLQLKDKNQFRRTMEQVIQFSGGIDNLNSQKQKELINSLLENMKQSDMGEIDESLLQMEEIIRKMNEYIC